MCNMNRNKNLCVFFSPDPVDRSPGHLWFWGLWEQQFWTVLHQLRQRTAAALLQPTHLQIRTGTVLFSLLSSSLCCSPLPLPLHLLSVPFCHLSPSTQWLLLQLLITHYCSLCCSASVTPLTTLKHSYMICCSVSWYHNDVICTSLCCGCYMFFKNCLYAFDWINWWSEE